MSVLNDRAAGGCGCGAVRFTVMDAPRFVANCHCQSCRRATGAAFSTYVGFAADHVIFAPDARAFCESSPGVRRGFCPRCGTALSYEGANWPGETHLFLGAFDDPHRYIPTSDAFPTERLAWAPLVTGSDTP